MTPAELDAVQSMTADDRSRANAIFNQLEGERDLDEETIALSLAAERARVVREIVSWFFGMHHDTQIYSNWVAAEVGHRWGPK